MKALMFLVALPLSGIVLAATPLQEQGRQLAINGASNGVAACVACHGASGEGNAAAGFPRIAGQSPEYLSRQITNFKNGSRNHPVMSPIAKVMTPQQIAASPAYYAALAAPASKPAAPDESMLKRGLQLAKVGDESLRIQACANCHGPGGAGQPPSFPYLAGQHASFLSAALSEWKTGARNTDPSGQMSTIAKMLGADDMTAVSAYYAQLPPPKSQSVPVTSMPSGGTAPRPPSKAAVVPEAGTNLPQGVGTEQGAPTTGGSQGPGGGGASTGSGTSPVKPP